MTLLTETNSHTVEKQIRKYAHEALLIRAQDMQTDFEHGQWWITNRRTGEQWSVCDADPGPFDFEQVTFANE